jgi:hypothetical protein
MIKWQRDMDIVRAKEQRARIVANLKAAMKWLEPADKRRVKQRIEAIMRAPLNVAAR